MIYFKTEDEVSEEEDVDDVDPNSLVDELLDEVEDDDEIEGFGTLAEDDEDEAEDEKSDEDEEDDVASLDEEDEDDVDHDIFDDIDEM